MKTRALQVCPFGDMLGCRKKNPPKVETVFYSITLFALFCGQTKFCTRITIQHHFIFFVGDLLVKITKLGNLSGVVYEKKTAGNAYKMLAVPIVSQKFICSGSYA